MEALLRRRTIRHLVASLLPLLVVGPVVVAVLAVSFAETAAPVREATARAVGVVQRSGLGADGREVEIAWRDDQSSPRISTVRAARAGEVPAGTEVQLHYRPGNTDRVFVAGDETSARLRDLAYGILLTALVVGAAVLVTAVHVGRRLAAERRPAATLPVSYIRSRRGIVRRSWLTMRDEDGQWWVPVHWDPVLPTFPASAPASVHGRPSHDRVVVVDVDGTTVWQSGRRRAKPPGGELTAEEPRRRKQGTTATEQTTAPAAAAPIGIGRQLRMDAALLITAPVIGLLWAYLDDGGAASWAAATAVSAAALVWLPALAGSDPT